MQSSNEGRISTSMGGLALAMGAAGCMGLVAYRMVYGDDHGHVHSRHSNKHVLWMDATVRRKKQGACVK
jgi:hypothetical protein